MKKRTSVMFLIVSLLTMVGCSVQGDIKFTEDRSDDAIIYDDVKYNEVTDINFDITTNENDIELGYQNTFKGYRGFFSDTAENPVYIFVSQEIGDYDLALYIREDYDYKSKTLVLDNTTDKIVYSDAFIKTESKVEPEDYLQYFQISLYFEDCPRLKIVEDIYLIDGKYYYIVAGQRFILSDELLNILKKNDLLQN